MDSISELSRFRQLQISYLYYQTGRLGSHAAELSHEVPSQLLRRIACDALGISELWDWREKPLRQVLEQFKKEYKSVASASS
jgi:hypothetical protein